MKNNIISQEEITEKLRKILWLIPCFLVLHNIEEAVLMPEWVSQNISILRDRFWFFQHLQFSSRQIYISLLGVTVIPMIVSCICLSGELTLRKISIMIVLQGIIGWNAVVPHISGFLLFGLDNPGTITAALINLPFTVYLFRRIIKDRIIEKKSAMGIIAISLIAYLPIVYLNHLIAHSIDSMLN
jgi:hypothetical protein